MISGELRAPFTLGGERIPFTIIEIVKFLNSKSTHSMRFADILSYICADFGIVLYPYKTIDIVAGVSSTSTTQHIAICNNAVLQRYFQHFISKQENKSDTLNSDLMGKIGCFIEERIEEEECGDVE